MILNVLFYLASLEKTKITFIALFDSCCYYFVSF